MNFTREPIIETIITPKEGYKLLVRSSKATAAEEYSVEAVEVVSFGHSFFFRCLERPKCFLVPVSDYEVLEVKEARVALKNVNIERTIKIGGGREGPMRREHAPERANGSAQEGEEIAASTEETASEAPLTEHRFDKKRDRRRNRRRRSSDDRQDRTWTDQGRPSGDNRPFSATAEPAGEGGGAQEDETPVSSSLFSTLIPPPTTLISETIGRYKEKDATHPERTLLPKPLEAKESEDQSSEEKREPHKKATPVSSHVEESVFDPDAFTH